MCPDITNPRWFEAFWVLGPSSRCLHNWLFCAGSPMIRRVRVRANNLRYAIADEICGHTQPPFGPVVLPKLGY